MGEIANSHFRHCMELVRMAYPQNLSQPLRVGSAIFRMQGAEGCVSHFQLISENIGNFFNGQFFWTKVKLW